MNIRLLIGLLFALTSSMALAQWRQMPGQATEIGVGARGEAWVIGIESVKGGHPIYRWNGHDWDRVEGGAVRVSVDPEGRPWVVNSSGEVLRQEGGAWHRLPGRVRDIGIGANGEVWAVGVTRVPGGYDIYRWNGRDWERESGGATRIAVDPQGVPWVVNDRGEVFRRTGGEWERLPGSGRAVTVDSSGTAWLLGTDRTEGGHTVHRWNGRNWERVSGGAIALAAGREVWLVNRRNRVFRQEGRGSGY